MPCTSLRTLCPQCSSLYHTIKPTGSHDIRLHPPGTIPMAFQRRFTVPEADFTNARKYVPALTFGLAEEYGEHVDVNVFVETTPVDLYTIEPGKKRGPPESRVSALVHILVDFPEWFSPRARDPVKVRELLGAPPGYRKEGWRYLDLEEFGGHYSLYRLECMGFGIGEL